MEILVGFTGFVGSNLCGSHLFDGLFNSQNITGAFGMGPDLCVYAGVRAEKFLANTAPEKDAALISGAIENIQRIKPRRLVLISTVDVYPEPAGVDERSPVNAEGAPYGANRYRLEQWVREHHDNYLIVRLPGLFGKNIKKNFIYDLIQPIPSMLDEKKFKELSALSEIISRCYARQNNGFYACTAAGEERERLGGAFLDRGFSALHFTDSRAVFQFYNLSRLWEHIEIALKQGLRLLNLVTEPVSAGEIYARVRGGVFTNELKGKIPYYNVRTIHAESFGGKGAYLFDKKTILEELAAFAGSRP
jgi:hypothetical protein